MDATLETASEAYVRGRGLFIQSKGYLQNSRNLLPVPANVDADVGVNMARNVGILVPIMQQIVATPGLVTFAQSAAGLNDPTADPIAKFTAWRDALFAIRDQIMSTFPNSGGFLLREKFNADGSTTSRTFPNTTPSIVMLVSLIDAAIATI